MINYRVRIKRGENEIEVEGDKKYITQIIKEFGFENEIGTLVQAKIGVKKETSDIISSKSLIGKISTAEFVLKYQLKKHTDLVLGFGYYLEKIKGLEKFTPADITNCYYEAKIESSNTSQMIIQNIRRGFFMQAKGSKEGKGRIYYTVTQSGISFVENGFKKQRG